MKKDTYLNDLKTKSRQIDQRLAQARRQFEEGDVQSKVGALKDITWLETRQKDLAARLEEAEAKHVDDWAEWHKGLQKDFDGVTDTLERILLKLR